MDQIYVSLFLGFDTWKRVVRPKAERSKLLYPVYWADHEMMPLLQEIKCVTVIPNQMTMKRVKLTDCKQPDNTITCMNHIITSNEWTSKCTFSNLRYINHLDGNNV